MGTVQVYSATRMKQIEDNAIIGGFVDVNGNLLLQSRAGAYTNAGYVKGEPGTPGQDGTPRGSVVMFAGSVAPTGWLLCRGQAVSRTTYANLFGIVGTIYGAGDGSTTFNLPNLVGRVPVGLDSAQTDLNALGKMGGASTHALTTAELAVHSHAMNSPSSGVLATQAGGSTTTDNGGGALVQGGTTGRFNKLTSFQGSTLSNGSGEPHNNMQPFVVMNYMIKT